MIARASGLGMGVGRISTPLRGVGVMGGLDTGLDTRRCVAVPPCGGVLRMLPPCVAVGVFIDTHCVADRLEVTR
jgi:hypothetical protein